jgi:hypothetical protein
MGSGVARLSRAPQREAVRRNISGAIAQLTTLVQGVGFGDTSLINISTDGEPTTGSSDAVAIRNGAVAAGWDSLSAEAIGNFNQTFLNTLVYPQPGLSTNDPNALPNPLTQGFVLRVDNFADYQGAISAKIQRIVQVPEPGTLTLLGLAGVWFGFGRRRKA